MKVKIEVEVVSSSGNSFQKITKPRKQERRRQDGRDDNGPRGGRRGGGGGGRVKDEVNKGQKSDVICAYYMQGKCQKTHEECVYSHNAVPPRKMELCKFWMMDCCAKREKCLYLHNDFPCKFYHTGLVCKQAERCKFSHKPLNEITKAVLLKHIETAPKEILGDFPRLNRNGALNLINKMESKILGALAEQERQKEKDNEPPRRTRWEQPTRDDQEKLQELMEEAGIGGYYRETLECQPPPVVPIPTPHITQHQPGLPSLMGAMPLPFIPPAPSAPIIPQPSPVLVHNAALANVLANLNIPSTTIQPIVQPQQQQHQQQITNPFEETKTVVPHPHISPPVAPSVLVQPKQEPDVTESPYWNANIANATNPPVKDEPSNILHDPPEHLPPMQKELFLRIQQQQLKHENKVVKAESDEDERPDDDGWYSSDEDERENRGKSSGFKDSSSKAQSQNHSISQPQAQPTIDISSVISSIRQTVELPNTNLNKRRNSPSPPSNHGDIDLRTTTSSGGQSQSTNNQSHGPFGDTDFRLPSHRPDLRDIDLRLTSSPPGPGPVPSVPSTASENARLSTNPLAFLKLPSGPATEIDASINSHPPVQYKLKIVLGVEAPDYRYIRHTMTPSQLLMDPRLGPRPGSGTLSLIPDPASPPSSLHGPPPVSSHHSPATIPAGDSLIMDPRVRRSAPGQHGQQQQQMHQPQMPLPPSQMPGLLGDPRFPRDPRTIQIGVPGGWPSAEDMNMSQAALAAQFMNVHQQMGIPPLFPNFPNAPGFPNPFMQPDFSGFNQGGPGPGPMGHHSRQQFQNNHGQGRGRPVSSWERYSQQQSDQDGSNIGTARGMTP